MVLAELGGKLRDSLRKFQASSPDGSQLNTLLSEIARALIESDVNVKLVMKLRENVKKKISSSENNNNNNNNNQNMARFVQNAVMEELTSLLTPTSKKAYTMRRGKANICLFVGLQGAGKTTTIAKFANYYANRGWKTCMVCADTFRAGAFDQLKQNATKLRIPFYGSYTEADPVVIAEDGVRQFVKDGYEVIIVDTSGRHQQEASLLEEMQEIAGAIRPHNTVFVVDATQGQAVYDQALAFSQAVDVGSVIVTKLDGHAKGGGALSAVSATQSPILFLGSGEHFEDLETFHAQSFVSKLLGYGDVRGLMEEIKSMQDDGKKQDDLMEKMSKGQFTLRDMYNQFSKVLKIGPLNKLMGMVPGMPEHLIPKDGDEDATRRLRVYLYMMDSMTNAELDGGVRWHATTKKPQDPTVPSRIRRIARGSGTHPKEVELLLKTHQQMETFAVRMGKAGGGQNMEARQKQMAAQLRKNPNLLQQRLNQMDPRMIQQMGGTQNVMNMMQNMAKGGGGQEQAMQAMMQNAMGGGFPGMPPGMPPGMDMNSMAQMMQQMGGGGGGGGMDMAKMMQQMGMRR